VLLCIDRGCAIKHTYNNHHDGPQLLPSWLGGFPILVQANEMIGDCESGQMTNTPESVRAIEQLATIPGEQTEDK
jgi:hypothetical protein